MESKYMIIYGNEIESMNLVSDLKGKNNIILHQAKKINHKGLFYNAIRKIFLSRKINSIINLPFSCRFLEISKYKFKNTEEYFIIAFAESFKTYDYYLFNKLNKKKNIHLIAVFLDSMNAHTPIVEKQKRLLKKVKWDYVFSFDKNDCNEYGFEYLEEKYYSNNGKNLPKEIENDIYFIGRVKPGRKKEIIDIYNYLNKNGIKADFNFVFIDDKIEKVFTDEELNNGIHYYNYFIKYNDILKKVSKSKCILEYNTTGQTSQSLRYFEAVTLNKKLLTNNQNVKRLNFYNEKYMKIFNNIYEIDIDWLKNDMNIDYGYNNEFSPIGLIDMLKELYNNKRS